MQVNDLLRMELMAEMYREAACIFGTAEAMEPRLINNFAAAVFCAFKDFGTGSEGDCNTYCAQLRKYSPVIPFVHFLKLQSVHQHVH